MNIRSLGLLTLLCLSSNGQDMTPVDSLYASDSLGFTKRIILKPIQWWQHFSYAQPGMNCQFEKSCSNYMVAAIQTKGVIRGVIMGTDRIVRCNPAARHYQLELPQAQIQYDGRLVDPVNWQAAAHPGKHPVLAMTLSIIPGLGRSYAGHPVDGLLSFLLVGGFAYNTYNQQVAGNPVRSGINGGLMVLFWAADIYGAYRTAKMAPTRQPRAAIP